MNRLNRKVEYALMALKHMSGRQIELFSVREICSSRQIPFDATSRVMQKMAQKKILTAEQGAQGGYRLAVSLSEISFLNVLEAVNGPIGAVRCSAENKACEFFANCNIASPLQIFNQRLLEFYSSLTVAELLSISMSSDTGAGKTDLESEARSVL